MDKTFNGKFYSDGCYEDGELRSPNGKKFAGSFYPNNIPKNGIFTLQNGMKFTGLLNNNLFSTFKTGRLDYNSFSYYVGEFENNRRHGQGELVLLG